MRRLISAELMGGKSHGNRPPWYGRSIARLYPVPDGAGHWRVPERVDYVSETTVCAMDAARLRMGLNETGAAWTRAWATGRNTASSANGTVRAAERGWPKYWTPAQVTKRQYLRRQRGTRLPPFRVADQHPRSFPPEIQHAHVPEVNATTTEFRRRSCIRGGRAGRAA